MIFNVSGGPLYSKLPMVLGQLWVRSGRAICPMTFEPVYRFRYLGTDEKELFAAKMRFGDSLSDAQFLEIYEHGFLNARIV